MSRNNRNNKRHISVTIQVGQEELIESLFDLEQDELFKLIEELDARMADWDFTEKLYEHFAKLHEDYLRETAVEEQEDKSDETSDSRDSPTNGPPRVHFAHPGARHHPRLIALIRAKAEPHRSSGATEPTDDGGDPPPAG